MSFILVINRIDVLINRIERLIAATLGVPADELPPEVIVPLPEIVIEQLPNCYKIFDLDLSVVRSDEPLGLADILKGAGVKHATYMSIIAVPAAFTFKMNNTGFDAIDAAVGLEWDAFEITEIFITNTALSGIGRIQVEYRVD